MKNFPIICVDDFYDDPDFIRNFALKQEYATDPTGKWPGKRTAQLDRLNKNMFDRFCKKILSLMYENVNAVQADISTGFQIIEPYDSVETSPKNRGWIHTDENCVFAGIVYLNPNPNPNTGTSMYSLSNPEFKHEDLNTKTDFFKNGKDSNYDTSMMRHCSAFTETVKINNVYNRLVAFDSSIYHGANSFYTTNEPRLTQVFFVHSINAPAPAPGIRQKFL